MDVGFSEEQTLLRDSARDFLRRECPMALVREQMDDPRGLPEALWRSMAELGWLGLLVPEAHGGSGLGLLDVAIVLEEMGQALCPGPFVSTAVVAATVLAHGGTEAQQARWLPDLVAGSLRFALAQTEADGSWEPGGIRLRAEPRDGGLRLSGTKHFVADVPAAGWLLVAARLAGSGARGEPGVTLALVDTTAAGLSVRPVACNERVRKRAELRFEDVAVPADQVIGAPGEGWPLLARAHAAARTALSAELAGAAQRVLDLSVGYARTREQFGQPIGRFQAIQHRCADMLVGTEGIRSAAWYAAWALDHAEPEAATTACLAKAYASDTALAVAGSGIQIHGGLGFTWEQDLHLYYKHAQAAALDYGSPSALRARAADALIGPAAGGP
jgi:alkylation response protein AidB-like acyl-CoA dehydrogenase